MKKILLLLQVLCLAQAGTVKADTDLSFYDNVIYVAPATINPAVDGAEVTLSICMNNTAEIRGFQFDMYLPDGITAKTNNQGKIVALLSSERLDDGDSHTLSVIQQANGALRFLCGSMDDETFLGNSGEIATINVSIEGVSDGSYPVVLKAMKLTETDIRKFYLADEVSSTLTISITTDISSVQFAKQFAPVYDLQGRRINDAKKGFYIQNGKKVVK